MVYNYHNDDNDNRNYINHCSSVMFALKHYCNEEININKNKNDNDMNLS